MEHILVLNNLGLRTMEGSPSELVSVREDVSSEQMEALAEALKQGE